MVVSFVSHQPLTPTRQRSVYPADLLPALQSTLGALADIGRQYAIERDDLEKAAGPLDAKQRLLADLQRRYEAERQPYVRQLSELQCRIAALLRRH